MTVYVDVLIILNIYVTYFILRAASMLLHASYSVKRLIAASVLGGVFSLVSVLDTGFFLGLPLKFLLVGITVFVAFGFDGIKRFILRTSLSVGISFVISGVIILIREFTGSGFVTAANGYIYMDISALTLLIATAVSYGILALFRRILDKPSSDKTVTLIIENKGKSAVISAYPDSGNNLVDFLSGKPVVVCRADAVREVLPENAMNVFENTDGDISGIRVIPYSTLSGAGVVAAFSAERITAVLGSGEKRLDILIGISKDALGNESFDAVINPKILI